MKLNSYEDHIPLEIFEKIRKLEGIDQSLLDEMDAFEKKFTWPLLGLRDLNTHIEPRMPSITFAIPSVPFATIWKSSSVNLIGVRLMTQ